MARASTRTLLPLDRWAFHLGLEPRHFNGVTTALRPQEGCQQPWLQYAWQAADRVGREEVAEAIAAAEHDLLALMGYYPLPVWIADEIRHTPALNDVTLCHSGWLQNPKGLYLGVRAAFGHVVSGGIQAKELISAAAAVVWSDPDGDSYDEIATITAPTTVTDVNEIRVYFAGYSQVDEWEIRPLKKVTIAGGNVTIQIERHLLVDPDLWEALDARAVDGDVDGNFVTLVEVYRVYNDPSQQAQLQWERYPGQCACGSATCAMCAWAAQWACLQARDPRLGLVTYQPATWNETTEEFDAASLAVNRAPERVRLYYRAGFASNLVARPYVEMDPRLEKMITILSLTHLDREICGCDNVQAYIERWREDKALNGPERSYKMSAKQLDCPWGTMEGAWWTYNRAMEWALQRSVDY
jgi:hypothetical protein